MPQVAHYTWLHPNLIVSSGRCYFFDKFFKIHKTANMDEYLADMREAIDQLEEVDVGLPEKVIVCYTLKNLSREFDTIKQVILNTKPQPI